MNRLDNIYFTADTHFGHNAMLRYGRPFKSIEQMDAVLVQNWNSKIPKNAEVYHLGDFSFKGTEYTSNVLDRLNGRIHLVRGNHDSGIAKKLQDRFEWVKDYYPLSIKEGEERFIFILSHFPHLSWDRMHYGTYHLHGHCHGNLNSIFDTSRRMDVGVDTNEFHPYSLQEVVLKLSMRSNALVDHHT